MKPDEIVRALRKRAKMIGVSAADALKMSEAADLIESLQAENAAGKEANKSCQEYIESLKRRLAEALRERDDASERGLYYMEQCEKQAAEIKRMRVERDAAVEDLQAFVGHPCAVCVHLQDQPYCYQNCQNHDRENYRAWKWRGAQKGE